MKYDPFRDYLLAIWRPRGFCRNFGWQRWTVLRLFTYAFSAGAVIPMFLLVEYGFEAGEWLFQGDREGDR